MPKKKTQSKPSSKKPTPSIHPAPAPTSAKGAAVRVRMYRQGLGDCFLLSFGSDDKFATAAHVLIDCGTLGATTTGVTMKEVATSIRDTTDKKMALVVATHEHLDHVSGFNSQRDIFDSFTEVNHSWVAWTENPEDDLAKSLKKYKNDLGLAAMAATKALERAEGSDENVAAMADGIRECLTFVGDVKLGATFAKGVDEAMRYVATRAPLGNREFLKPGTFLQPDWLPGVTVFVLGPPHDEQKIKNMGEHGNPELYELSGSSVSAFRVTAEMSAHHGTLKDYCNVLGATKNSKDADAMERARDLDELDLSLPFDDRYRIAIESVSSAASYFAEKNKWRRIDTDWLFSSADLALQLDNLTNNTSLALAFEIGEDGPVILMAADSQLGNWLSWHDYTWAVPKANGTVRKLQAKDLLERTVIYKVGHHSSHNATAVTHGLEMMTSDSLVALIPLDKQVAEKKKWPMPASKLYTRLVEKTKGRVIRSDIGWPNDSDRPTSVLKSDWKKIPPNVQISEDRKYFDVVLNR